nr:AmmeMemoRadiSam system radical SAM enzyme [Candidatus Freyrarchaeum guaymaensis]
MKENDPCIKRGVLQEKAGGGKVRCLVCMRKCVIPDGGLGFCGTRRNVKGEIHTLTYGDISSISVNPIEKKPLFHFHPGSKALTVGSWSCNFTCPWCQNWEISKQQPDVERRNYVSPEHFIRIARVNRCDGTSISFNEPTLMLEYSLDVFRLARENGLYNTYVTNGYMTPEALRLLVEAGLDAMNVDVKGCREAVKKYCGADVEHVWRNIRDAKRMGVWVEVTTLIIPGVNDDEDCLRSIAGRIREIDADMPWHVTRFHPDYQMLDRPPTPVETLEKARMIGVDEGLKYVYVGNVPGHRWENTYCPSCGELLIERYVFTVVRFGVTREGRCPSCGERIRLVGGVGGGR